MMDTNDLRNIIKDKIREEGQTKDLENRIVPHLGKNNTQDVIQATQSILLAVPDLIDRVYSSAQSNHLLNHFQPIFNGLFAYWYEENDFIPDHLGLFGILDDAYLSISLMHLIANTQLKNQERLIPNMDLSQMINILRALIGYEMGNRLDEMVTITYQSAIIQNSITALTDIFAGSGQLNVPLGGIQGLAGQHQIQDQVNTQLGAWGVV